MTEQNQARPLLAMLRDALGKLEDTLGRTREGVDEIASRQNASVTVLQRCVSSGSVRTSRSG